MYKVATNVCYTFAEKAAGRRSAPGKGHRIRAHCTPKPAPTGGEVREPKRVQLLVQQAIAQLPEKYRIPLVLRYLEEFSYRQIAEAMDLPLTTIETRLYRGKALLQKRLDPILAKGGAP
ncbi:MAG: sigma-70 family RNA polymerase sigma factor [Bacillota bacterium]